MRTNSGVQNRTFSYNDVMTVVTASQARQTLPAQLDRVENGEQVEITRHGRVVAVLVSPAALGPRRAPEAWGQAQRIEELLAQARAVPLPAPAITASRADELVKAVRAGRQAR